MKDVLTLNEGKLHQRATVSSMMRKSERVLRAERLKALEIAKEKEIEEREFCKQYVKYLKNRL